MVVSSPPAFLQASSYPAALDRLHQMSVRYLPTALNTTDVAARSGIVGGQSGRQGNASMTNFNVNIGRFAAVIENTFTAQGGDYQVFNDATQTLAVTASAPTTNRIDIIGVRVQDAFYSGALNQADLVVVQGTATAGTPADPALPASFMPMYRITVNAGTTTGIVTDLRKRTAIMGSVYSPFAPQQLTDNGTMVGEIQLLAASGIYPARLRVWDGTAWKGVSPTALAKPAQTGSGSLTTGSAATIMSASVADPGYAYIIKAGGSIDWAVVAATISGQLTVCAITLDSLVYNVGNFAYGHSVSHSLGAGFSQPTCDAEAEHTGVQAAGSAHTIRMIARNSGAATITLPAAAPGTGMSVEVIPA